jgi:hypothetical protein
MLLFDMEPTTETPQKHFANKVTPVSKALALAFSIALPLLTLYVGYQAGMRNVQLETEGQGSLKEAVTAPVVEFERRELSSNNVRISVSLPKDWITTRSSEVESPDHELVPEDKYEPRTLSGAKFRLEASSDSYPDMTPAQFVEKEGEWDHKCGNCGPRETITIDGIPASQILLSNFDGKIQYARITLLKDGQKLYLSFSFDSYTPENEKILQEIVRTLRFES